MNPIEKEEQQKWQQMLERRNRLEKELLSSSKEWQQIQAYLVKDKGDIDPHEMFTNIRLQEQQIFTN